jgi:hypothetical protein
MRTKDGYRELTARGKDAYLDAMEAVSWFEHTRTPRAEIEERLSATAPEDFLFGLYELWFDPEGIEEAEDCADLLQRIAAIAGFEEAGIAVVYENATRTFDIDLTIGANVYRHAIPFNEIGGWIEEKLIGGFINEQVLPREGLASRFFELPPCDQTTQFVFLPPTVHDRAVEKGIIPGDAGYFTSVR